MTEHEVLIALREVIKPIHEFWQVRQKTFFIPDSEIHYEVPPKYLKAFSDLYLELVKHTGTPPVVDTKRIGSPRGLPAGTSDLLSLERRTLPAPLPSPPAHPKA